MCKIFQSKKKALTQVVTTLILLAISILLAGGTVGYYASSVAASTMKMEHLVFREARVWVNESGAQAAFVIENIGGRDSLIDAIEVNYVEESWSSIYYARDTRSMLFPVEGMNITGLFSFVDGNKTIDFVQGSDSIVLPYGECLIVYIDQPDSIELNYLGFIVHIAVYTPTLQYYELVDVEYD
jgi:FlaG/FlaF family flagellin (archaellin)